MIGIDTNILVYARVAGSIWHKPAVRFLDGLANNPDVVIAELVLVELYLALRNPAILASELSPSQAVAECQLFRKHPHWQVVEVLPVMDEVWGVAQRKGFPRRRVIDARLALTLIRHGVKQFATANTKDFALFNFEKVWNPLLIEG